MNVMGIGPQEMMIIAVIALLVFGPGKLPEVMGQAGKLVRDFRRMSTQLSGEFEKTIAEARDMTSGLTAELGGMSKEVNSITNGLKKDLGVKGTTTTAKKTTTGAKSTTPAKSTTASRTTTSKTSTTAKTTGAKSTTPAKTTTSTKTSTVVKKPPVPVATREDPTADVFLFEPAPVERAKRTRKAVPSMIADPTPRLGAGDSNEGLNSILGTEPELVAADDAVSRARQRRRNAGYSRAQA